MIISFLFYISTSVSIQTELLSKSNKCPFTVCSSEPNKTCIIANNVSSDYRVAVLSSCPEQSQKCQYILSDIFSEEAYSANCNSIQEAPSRLPGEKCMNDSQCEPISIYNSASQEFYRLQRCSSHFCEGAQTSERCYDNKSCTMGNYCKTIGGGDSICTPQLEEGEICQSTYHCKNNLFCSSDKKCTQAFSLELGSDITYVPNLVKNMACESGFYGINYHSHFRCAKLKYKKEYQPNEKGLVECEIGTECEYDLIFTESGAFTKPYKMDCECGLNEKGKSYCPFSRNDISTEQRFNQILDMKKKNLNTPRHTLNRLAGDYVSNISPSCFSYFESSRFVNANSCVKERLGYGMCEDIEIEDLSVNEILVTSTSKEENTSSNFSGFLTK